MTGCLQVKNGKFYVVLSVYEEGKRKRKWLSTGLPERGNKRRAEQMLREKLREYELRGGETHTDVTLSDYIRHWLTLAKKRVDEVTFQGYEVLAKSQLLPYFDRSGVLLQDVTLKVLQAYIDEKAARGRIDGKGGLSPRSLRLHKNILNQTIDEAVKMGLLKSNPCIYLELPKTERYPAKFYSAQQLNELLEAIRDEPLYPLIKTTALYGLRRSEVLGLKWDSVDFENNTLTIRHTVSKVTKAVEKDKTKNASSHRTFPLLPEVRTLLLAERAAENENRRLFGEEYHENEYIFKWDDGRPYSPDYVTDKFSDLLKKYGFPHIRFHELRHSCASLLINSGFNLKDVQEWMGHSDIKMTANIYGHLDNARKQGMAEALSASFSV